MEIQAISSTTTTAILAKAQSTSESTTTSKTDQPAVQKVKGTPPAGGGGAKPAASSASSSSSTAKVYDKRDTDQDGIVSYQEELLYSLNHPPEEIESQSTVSTSQIQAGLNAYQQSQQASSLSKS
jgi:hypothetical protein